MSSPSSAQNETLFENPFRMEDLFVFDNAALRSMLRSGGFGLTAEQLGLGLQGASRSLVEHILQCLPFSQRASFLEELLTGTFLTSCFGN
jgi:flagellar motor switch protein FliG